MCSKTIGLGIIFLLNLVIEASLVNADSWQVGESCTPEGKIVCSASRFQQCASGAWSVQISLARGVDCNFFNASSNVAPTATSSTTLPVNDGSVPRVYSSVTIIQSTLVKISSTSGSGNSQPVVPQKYSGPASTFPPVSSWLTFDRLWDRNKAVCEKNPDGKALIIHDDILRVAKETGVDARIILTVILQESTCSLSVPKPGLMQSHSGVGYTDDASILQMIRDGTAGTYHKPDGGDGLKQLIQKYNVYGGLRAYNSGDLGLNVDDLSSASIGTPSYVSDVAKRLTGAMIAS